MTSEKGLIFDIQHYCIHDGPGIRTVVFMKGCPLKCLWCCNPESQKNHPEMMFFEKKCVGLKECKRVCPEDAILESADKRISVEKCNNCGLCAEVCYANAVQLSGKYMTIEEVMREIEKDKLFYKNSGGGITLSGGEPTAQEKFTAELLAKCKESGLHTTIETCGYIKWESLKEILNNTDLVLYDLKCMDSELHKKYTGVANDLILSNLKKIIDSRYNLIIRVPFVPEYNNSRKNIEELANFLRGLDYTGEIHLLPFHNLGEQKYLRLDKPYGLRNLRPPDKKIVEDTRKFLESFNFKVSIGG